VSEIAISEAFTIRVATMADVPALHRLIERSVNGLQTGEYSEAQRAGALGHTLGLDTQLVKDGTYFVVSPAGETGVLAASGGWSYRSTTFGSDGAAVRDASVLDPTKDAAKIRAIFVDPEFARRGLGSRMLAHCEAAAMAAGFRSFVMGSTLTGVPLYTLKGYRKVGRIEVPLPNGEVLPIVSMAKVAGNEDAPLRDSGAF
jgi:ribosomal protein S18 acetylase RimI-like enzyme